MTVNIDINSFPIKLNTLPIPPTNVNLIVLANTVSNASFAATQKFLPVIAIYIYAYLVKNLMNLSKYSI